MPNPSAGRVPMSPVPGPMAGKVVLVSGASAGIGEAVVRALGGAGASVFGFARGEERLRKAADAWRAAGIDVRTAAGDVSVEADVDRIVRAALDAYGRIDILVNNAGIAPVRAVDGHPVDVWDRTIAVNLRGPFLLTRRVLPDMLRRGAGDIVNVSSVAGLQAFGEMSAYCASKFGLQGFTQALAHEVRKRGIRVVAVCPGAVSTPIWEGIDPSADRTRMLRADDVARAVLDVLLLSRQATVDQIVLTPPDGIV